MLATETEGNCDITGQNPDAESGLDHTVHINIFLKCMAVFEP
jgi:hypothetical protein